MSDSSSKVVICGAGRQLDDALDVVVWDMTRRAIFISFFNAGFFSGSKQASSSSLRPELPSFVGASKRTRLACERASMKKPYQIGPTLAEILIQEARMAREAKAALAEQEREADDRLEVHIRTFLSRNRTGLPARSLSLT